MKKKSHLKQAILATIVTLTILVVGMVVGISDVELPTIGLLSASAAENEPIWTVATTDMLVVDGDTIAGYTSALSGDIEIPERINGITITKIDSNAFEGCNSLTSVKIPETISYIGKYAFRNCGLTKVYFNARACEIYGEPEIVHGYISPFVDNPNLTEFEFGKNVATIPGEVCAKLTSLNNVTFKGSVTEIGRYAFYNCTSLSMIDISNVQVINESAFENCNSLVGIDRNESAGVIAFSDKLRKIQDNAFSGCSKITQVTIPESATYIGKYAFANCGLTKVYFNARTCEIYGESEIVHGYISPFVDNPNLTEFEFGKNAATIPGEVCAKLTSLNNVTFNGSVTEIGRYAFYNCTSLSKIDISNVQVINESAFENCNSLVGIDGNESAGVIAFSDKLRKIKDNAFSGCSKITQVTIPESATYIGKYAFANCGLTKVYFNAGTCEIYGEPEIAHGYISPFVDNPNLTEFEFGKNVATIPGEVCAKLTSLNNVTFKGSVTEIGRYAFYNCTSLSKIDISNVQVINESAFENCNSLIGIDGNESAGVIAFSDKLRKIKDYAFSGCSKITQVTIPYSVTYIGWNAFNCVGLNTVYFNSPNCTMYDDGYAPFAGTNLKTVIFGKNVTSIPENVCSNARSLQGATFEGRVTQIGNGAFKNCTGLSEIILTAYFEDEFDYDSLVIGDYNDTVTREKFSFGKKITKTDTAHKVAITVEYSQNAFDEEVELVVEDVKEAREPGAIYVIGNEKREQVGCLNIKMVSAITNEPVQPNNRVIVKMEIPEEFIGQNEFRIVHTYNDKTRRGLSTSASNKDNLIKISPDGKFLIFSVPHFSEFEVSAVIPNNPATITINNNIGAATIKFGETLRLNAKTGNLPKDAEICWYVNGEKMASGETFDVNLQGGTYEIVVKLVGKDGNVLKDDSGHEISDSEKVTVKANLWLRIIAFFKNLFGKNSIIVQSLYVIK